MRNMRHSEAKELAQSYQATRPQSQYSNGGVRSSSRWETSPGSGTQQAYNERSFSSLLGSQLFFSQWNGWCQWVANHPSLLGTELFPRTWDSNYDSPKSGQVVTLQARHIPSRVLSSVFCLWQSKSMIASTLCPKEGRMQARTRDWDLGSLVPSLGTLPTDYMTWGYFPNVYEFWLLCLEIENYATWGLTIKIQLESAHDLESAFFLSIH